MFTWSFWWFIFNLGCFGSWCWSLSFWLRNSFWIFLSWCWSLLGFCRWRFRFRSISFICRWSSFRSWSFSFRSWSFSFRSWSFSFRSWSFSFNIWERFFTLDFERKKIQFLQVNLKILTNKFDETNTMVQFSHSRSALNCFFRSQLLKIDGKKNGPFLVEVASGIDLDAGGLGSVWELFGGPWSVVEPCIMLSSSGSESGNLASTAGASGGFKSCRTIFASGRISQPPSPPGPPGVEPTTKKKKKAAKKNSLGVKNLLQPPWTSPKKKKNRKKTPTKEESHVSNSCKNSSWYLQGATLDKSCKASNNFWHWGPPFNFKDAGFSFN